MLELLSNNYFFLFTGAIFFLFLLYMMFAFAGYIPHFLLVVYFTLPLFYEITQLPPLPLTTIFVVLFGPVILWGTNLQLIASFWPIAAYILLVLITSYGNGVMLHEHKSFVIPIVISLLAACSFSNKNIEKRIKIFSLVIVCWIVLNAIFSLLQLTMGRAFYLIAATGSTKETLGVERGYGLIGMATQVGVTFCLGVPLIASLLLDERRKKTLLLLAFALGCFGLVVSFSRGAIVGVFIALYFLLIFYKKYKLLSFLSTAGILLLLFYGSLMTLLPDNLSFFLQGKDGSASARVPYTMIALEMFIDRPITGFGFGGYYKFCTEYGSPIHIEAHNTYAQVLVEYGLIGFLLFLLVITLSIRGYVSYLRRGRSAEIRVHAIGYLSGLIAVLIDAAVHCFEWNLQFWLPLAFGYLMHHLRLSEQWQTVPYEVPVTVVRQPRIGLPPGE